MDDIAKGDQKKDDERGHIIADRFGGAEFGNLVAQHKDLNKGEYKKWEDQMAAEIKKGNEVKVSIDLKYSAESHRPDRLIISYSVNKEEFIKVFRNEGIKQ